MINELVKKKLNILILTGSSDESSQIFDEFRSYFLSKIEREYQNNIFFYQSHLKININFILIGTKLLILNNSSFLSWDYEKKNIIIPTIIIEGGKTPISFLEYTLDLIPKNLDLRELIENHISDSISNLDKTLSNDRIELLNKFENCITELKSNMQISFIDGVKSSIGKIKNILNQIEEFDIVDIIYDYENKDILIDTMREYRDEIAIITDEIDKDKLGPNFEENLQNFTKVSIILNRNSSMQKENLWNLGISKLETYKQNFENVKYEIIDKNYLLNMIYFKNNIIIFSNYRFLSQKRIKYQKFLLKNLGIIIYSNKINDFYDNSNFISVFSHCVN